MFTSITHAQCPALNKIPLRGGTAGCVWGFCPSRMRTMKSMFRAVVAAIMIAAPGTAALAEARLVSSTPAANATVDKPGKIIPVFNEKLMAKLAAAELTMTGMPGIADHHPMKMTGFTTALGADGKTLTLLMKRALPSGSYELKWFAAGADADRRDGSFTFTVK